MLSDFQGFRPQGFIFLGARLVGVCPFAGDALALSPFWLLYSVLLHSACLWTSLQVMVPTNHRRHRLVKVFRGAQTLTRTGLGLVLFFGGIASGGFLRSTLKSVRRFRRSFPRGPSPPTSKVLRGYLVIQLLLVLFNVLIAFILPRAVNLYQFWYYVNLTMDDMYARQFTGLLEILCAGIDAVNLKLISFKTVE